MSPARMGGQVLVNGYPRVQKTFAHVEGYVEDIMAYVPYMTVREGIEFSAAMRLSRQLKIKERKLFAEEVNDWDLSDILRSLLCFSNSSHTVENLPLNMYDSSQPQGKIFCWVLVWH